MDAVIKSAGKITGVHWEPITLSEPFVDFTARFKDMPGTVILLSGGDMDCARYHIMAARPWLTFRGRGSHMQITTDGQAFEFEENPFDMLRKIINAFRIDPADLPVPIAGGLFGYLAYDLKDHLEELPRTSVDDLNLPDICLFAPSIILVQDKLADTTHLVIPQRTLMDRQLLEDDRRFFHRMAQKPIPQNGKFIGDAAGFKSNFIRPDYEEAIETIKEYIAAGDVYQVNMSQRFAMDFKGDGLALFKALYKHNPAPFFAFINAGDHQVVSTSPERFVRLNGKQVETRPIKGTRPRGKSELEDARLKRELQQSKKDDAELSMIVDLLRNDVGKVCTAGSVRVVEHKRLVAYRNVYHLVSLVEGELDQDRDAVDLLRATFPGGSITGCPKKRAMEIIDELEPTRRHVYTGAIGYIGFHDSMDLNIAIRTAVINNGKIIFSVGGGIVFDSDPSDEFEETLHKGRTLMAVFEGDAGSVDNKNYAWANGIIKPIKDVSVPVSSPGFQYGYGFFETIYATSGRCPLIEPHISRFNRTWKHLMPGDPPDLTWETIIREVLDRNNLTQSSAAVKIIAACGERKIAPWDYTLVVTARPYVHRLSALKTKGLDVVTYPESRQTPIADFKSINYLYYHLAGRWAQENGAHEALIMNPDGTISETNTANILLIKGRTVLCPDSPHVLPGVMEAAINRLLTTWGYEVKRAKLRPKDMLEQDQVFLTNGLMGAVPVLSLDGNPLAPPTDLSRRINADIMQ